VTAVALVVLISAHATEPPLVREKTQASKLTPFLDTTAEVWSNLRGGNGKGTRWNTLVNGGLSADLGSVGGPRNAEILVQFVWVRNQDNDENIDAFSGAANPASANVAGNATRVLNLYYKQTWENETYALKVGQIAVDDDFMLCAAADVFSNASFGTIPALASTPLAAKLDGHPAFAAFPVAGPGVHFSARLDEQLSVQAGVYHGGPGPDEPGNHGFDWDRLSSAGIATFVETAWSSKIARAQSVLKIGASYHSGTFDNFRRINNGEAEATERGLYGFYLCQNIVFTFTTTAEPRLSAFWHLGISPQEDRTVVRTYADAGLAWRGAFAARANDTFGMAILWSEFGKEYRRHYGTNSLATSESVLEMAYDLELTANWHAKMDLQFVRTPSDASGQGQHRTATVFGIGTTVSF
jgi:porin